MKLSNCVALMVVFALSESCKKRTFVENSEQKSKVGTSAVAPCARF